ncbi:hypothetical protein FRC10_006839 [Ceratobasidium sp. 414]|nr:hypothetical protein FRC10_006839 [Ceratobasidium sp. 414]
MDYHDNWVINVNSGSMNAGPSENWYEAESASRSGAATVVSCSGCSGGTAVGYIGGDGNGVLEFGNVTSNSSTRTTLRIRAPNGDWGQRYATVTVNGVAQTVAFLPTANGQAPESSVVHVNLKKSGLNKVVIAGSGSGYAADVDGLIVPIS